MQKINILVNMKSMQSCYDKGMVFPEGWGQGAKTNKNSQGAVISWDISDSQIDIAFFLVTALCISLYT